MSSNNQTYDDSMAQVIDREIYHPQLEGAAGPSRQIPSSSPPAYGFNRPATSLSSAVNSESETIHPANRNDAQSTSSGSKRRYIPIYEDGSDIELSESEVTHSGTHTMSAKRQRRSRNDSSMNFASTSGGTYAHEDSPSLDEDMLAEQAEPPLSPESPLVAGEGFPQPGTFNLPQEHAVVEPEPEAMVPGPEPAPTAANLAAPTAPVTPRPLPPGIVLVQAGADHPPSYLAAVRTRPRRRASQYPRHNTAAGVAATSNRRDSIQSTEGESQATRFPPFCIFMTGERPMDNFAWHVSKEVFMDVVALLESKIPRSAFPPVPPVDIVETQVLRVRQ